jgi:hypothetical protein
MLTLTFNPNWRVFVKQNAVQYKRPPLHSIKTTHVHKSGKHIFYSSGGFLRRESIRALYVYLTTGLRNRILSVNPRWENPLFLISDDTDLNVNSWRITQRLGARRVCARSRARACVHQMYREWFQVVPGLKHKVKIFPLLRVFLGTLR